MLMLYPVRGFPLIVGILLLTLGHVAFGSATVVYNNSTHTKSLGPEGLAPDGFFPLNFYTTNETMGEEIILEGTAREVVQFDLILSSTELVPNIELTLILSEWLTWSEEKDDWYLLPEQILWTGTKNDVSVDGDTTVSFTVPNIVVPDYMAWFVKTDSLSENFGLATCDPATTGQDPEGFWVYSPPEDKWHLLWFMGDPAANFGATIKAVPEPTILGTLLLGGLFIGRRKRTTQ
jgi:hypothetical protein